MSPYVWFFLRFPCPALLEIWTPETCATHPCDNARHEGKWRKWIDSPRIIKIKRSGNYKRQKECTGVKQITNSYRSPLMTVMLPWQQRGKQMSLCGWCFPITQIAPVKKSLKSFVQNCKDCLLLKRYSWIHPKPSMPADMDNKFNSFRVSWLYTLKSFLYCTEKNPAFKLIQRFILHYIQLIRPAKIHVSHPNSINSQNQML